MQGYRDPGSYLGRLSVVPWSERGAKGTLTDEQRRMGTSSYTHASLIAVKLYGGLVEVLVYRCKNRLSRIERRIKEHSMRLDLERTVFSVR